MSSRVAAFLSGFFSFLAFVSVAAGLPRLKIGFADGGPLVAAFVVFVAAAIFFAWLEKRKRGEEQKRLSRF